MNFLVNWSELSLSDWIIIDNTIIIILILIFILAIYIYKRKRFKFKINGIISNNLLKITKKNYKFSNKNSFALFNEIKSIVLDKRYKYFYKFKKRYKKGSLDNELFDVVKKYYLKNEKESNKKSKKSSLENKKIEKSDVLVDKQDKKFKPVFDDENMTVKYEEEK